MNTESKYLPIEYRKMLERGSSFAEIKEAGFFQEKTYLAEDIYDFFVSEKSVQSLLERIPALPPNSILIGISGKFAPFHAGHLSALIESRQKLLKLGYSNVFAVIWPAHDSYIKAAVGEGYEVSSRIHQIKESIINCDWICVDEFPATELREEVNFTYLVNRLEKVAEKIGAQTGFVFGEDNYLFALPLRFTKTLSIIVTRDGFNHDVDRLGLCNCIFINDNPSAHYSSTAIRKTQKKPIYALRDDSFFSDGYKPKIVAEIATLLEKCTGFQVVVIDAKSQIETTNKVIKDDYSDYSVLSLDKYFVGDFNLNISRTFKAYALQESPSGFYIQNEVEFYSWLGKRAKDKIVVVDDDISSSSTKRKILEMLSKKNFKTIEFISMLHLSTQDLGVSVIDVVDYRDFVPINKHSGLLCKMPDRSFKRCLYRFPIVDLVSRAAIPPSRCIEFSKELNYLLADYGYVC